RFCILLLFGLLSFLLCVSTYLTCFFCFYCSFAHRDLHSFPTRRSSDLRVRGLDRLRDVRQCAHPDTADRLPRPLHGRLVVQFHRSEEHTSELQSRENLVCRLLLEKKNFKTRRKYVHWQL